MFFIWLPRKGRTTLILRAFAVIFGVFVFRFLLDAWNVGDSVRVLLFAPAFLSLCVVAVRPRWPATIACLLICGGSVGYETYLKTRESAALRPIARAACELVRPGAQFPKQAAEDVSITGKILVWDVPNDRLSAAHYKLPAALRATTQDQAMTLFLLWDTESRKVGAYHLRGEAVLSGATDAGPGAFRDTADLAVVAWPDRRLLGWHAVVGDEPPKTIQISQGQPGTPQHGDVVQPIARWIQSLPGLPSSPASAPLSLFTSASTPAPAWTEATAQKEAVRRYPQLAVSSSPMNHAFVEKYKQLQATNPAYLRDPAWPLRLADEVANQGSHP